MYWGDFNQQEAEDIIKKQPIVILPIGAIEVHGDHLPLMTDVYLAEGISKKVCDRLSNTILLPTMPYGQIWSLRDKPGCISVSDQTLIGFLAELGRSLHDQGIQKFAVINGHVGNVSAIKAAQRVLFDECSLKMFSFTYPGVEKAQAKVLTTKRPHKAYFHACEIETSYMLYICPDKVDMAKAIRQYPDFPPDFDVIPSPWSSIMDKAVMGDATAATAEKGKAMIEQVVDTIVALLS